MRARGGTFIELIIAVMLLGVTALAVWPTIRDLAGSSRGARMAATVEALGVMRLGIETFRANDRALGGSGRYPTIDEVNEVPLSGGANTGSQVTFEPGDIPVNPWAVGKMFSGVLPDTVMAVGSGDPFGSIYPPTPTSNRVAGWVYDPTTGAIWANSNVQGENVR